MDEPKPEPERAPRTMNEPVIITPEQLADIENS